MREVNKYLIKILVFFICLGSVGHALSFQKFTPFSTIVFEVNKANIPQKEKEFLGLMGERISKLFELDAVVLTAYKTTDAYSKKIALKRISAIKRVLKLNEENAKKIYVEIKPISVEDEISYKQLLSVQFEAVGSFEGMYCTKKMDR